MNNPGGLDSTTTSAIPQPSTPQGMAPLVIPNDPLGAHVNDNPLGGNLLQSPQTNSYGSYGITSPNIR